MRLVDGLLALVLWGPLMAQGQENGQVLKEGKLPSGRKMEMLHWEGTERGYVLISYPKDFDLAESYHINFAFPGTEGTPRPGIEDRHDRYIGILMSYLDQSNVSNEQYAKDHWALCLKVEAALRKRVPIKVGQRVVSGVSKGGWLAFFMSLHPPKGLDGVAIIAAGRDVNMKKVANLNGSGLSVFVGTGETDPNYPYAQLANAFYRECGLGNYTYEEWLGKGHTTEISPRVQEWLEMVAMSSQPKDAFAAHCEKEVSAAFDKLKKLPDVLERYRAVRHLMNAPHMQHVTADFRAKIAQWGRDLQKDDKVEAWSKSYDRLRGIVRAEVKVYETNSVEIENLQKIDAAYRELAMQVEFEDIRARACHAHVRNRKVITMLELRKKAREKQGHAAMEKKLQELYRQISSSPKEDPEMMAEFTKLHRELAVKRSKLNMDSFYKVEWEGKYALDGDIKKLMGQLPEKPAGHAAYSGVRY